MTKVILYIATSLDGYIAKVDHDLSWLTKFQVPEEDYGYRDFIKNISAIMMGNSSFQVIREFGDWPYADKQCFVATHTSDVTTEPNVTFVTDPAATIAQLKEQNEGDIWLLGGANLADSLLRLDLVDELIISTIPVLLGNGIRLFSAPLPELNLELISSKQYDSGLIQAQYKILLD